MSSLSKLSIAFSLTPASARLSLLADHLSSTVYSWTANFHRTQTCLRILSLVTSHRVRPVQTIPAFHWLTRNVVGVWMYRFGFEGISEVISRTLTATSPRYSTIKELDRKVHEFRVPPETIQAIRGGPGVDPKSVPTRESMIAFMLSNIQDVGKSILLLQNNVGRY